MWRCLLYSTSVLCVHLLLRNWFQVLQRASCDICSICSNVQELFLLWYISKCFRSFVWRVYRFGKVAWRCNRTRGKVEVATRVVLLASGTISFKVLWRSILWILVYPPSSLVCLHWSDLEKRSGVFVEILCSTLDAAFLCEGCIQAMDFNTAVLPRWRLHWDQWARLRGTNFSESSWMQEQESSPLVPCKCQGFGLEVYYTSNGECEVIFSCVIYSPQSSCYINVISLKLVLIIDQRQWPKENCVVE